MITFLFVALVLAVYTAGGYIVYRFTKREFAEDFKAYQRHTRKKFKSMKAELAVMQGQINQISLMKTDGKAPGHGVVSPFERSEARHAEELKKIVVVDGVQKRVPAA